MKHDDEERVRELLRPLVESSPPPFEADRRASVWRRIQAERAHSASRWRIGVAAALTTAAAAAWLLMLPAPTTPPAPAAPTTAMAERGSTPVDLTGQTIRDARTLPSGAEVAVDGEVSVAVATATDTRLLLTRGSVRNVVPELAPGARYIVETPLAEVAVRGTVFEVRRADDGATVVEVTEGAVAVEPKDGRSGTLVRPGETVRVEPLTEAGARRAERRGDWREAIDVWRLLAERASEGLARRNLVLRTGRLISEHAPDEAPVWWRAATARYGDGTHAEEFAFRLAESLHRTGRADEARRAATRFRQRFPDSDRAAETLDW